LKMMALGRPRGALLRPRALVSSYPATFAKGYPVDGVSWTGQEAVWSGKALGWSSADSSSSSRLKQLRGETSGRPLRWGAEVEADLGKFDVAELAELVHRFQVVVFKRQRDFTPRRHVEVASKLTPLLGAKLPLTLATDMGFQRDELMAGFEEISVLGRKEKGFDEENRLGKPVNNGVKGVQWPATGACSWHADGAAFETVGSVTFIHMPKAARKGRGGKTLFASGYEIFDNLTPELQARAVAARVKYVEDGNWMFEYDMKANGMRRLNQPGQVESAYDHEHPLAPLHPVTRRRALWAAPANVAFAADQDLVEECLQTGLLDYYAHDYDDGDVVISDDRCMLHSVTPTAPDAGSRILHRCGTELRAERNRKRAFQYLYGDDDVLFKPQTNIPAAALKTTAAPPAAAL